LTKVQGFAGSVDLHRTADNSIPGDMTAKRTYLTKSRYIDGIRCSRKLWLGWYERLPHEDPEPFSILDVGNQIGEKAHLLFPRGKLVSEAAYEHNEAVERTRELINDPSIPAIFEAAFEHENVRVRVDVLERFDDSTWGLREVKSSSSASASKGHYDDVAVQLHVVEGTGLSVSSVELIHVNREYVRGESYIDWASFFSRTDLTDVARKRLSDVQNQLPPMHAILNQDAVPEVLVSRSLCTQPYRCEYIDRCMADKPDDWVGYLPRIGKNLGLLYSQGIESVCDIPESFELPDSLASIRKTILSGQVRVEDGLGSALAAFGPPAYYLDFETINPGIPFYPHTRPYERIAFQWSLHLIDEDGTVSHQEFLAPGHDDPRRAVAETLIDAIALSNIPIVVYHESTEKNILTSLGIWSADLAETLTVISDRIVDLHPLVRDHITHPKLFGPRLLESTTYSIKNVLPALVAGEDYKNLEGVSSGMEASLDFVRIINGAVSQREEQTLREGLRKYCRQDTQAMIDVQRVLVNMLNI